MRTGNASSTGTDQQPTALVAVVVGVIAALLSAAGSWRPSLWYDEAATVSAVHRSLGELAALLSHTDGVHAAYYLAMKAWTSVFGISEVALRAPSAIAIGLAAAAMVYLGAQLRNPAFGLLCALTLLTVPRVMWAGSEARSYAGTVLLAIVWTSVLVLAVRRGRWWWVGYAAVMVVATVWFFLSVTLVVAHAVCLLICTRRVPIAFIGAALVGVVAVSPFAWWVFGQRGQVSWIQPPSARTITAYARFEFFDGSVGYAVVAVVMVAAGSVALLVGRGDPDRRRLGRIGVCAAACVGVPAVAVAAVSLAGTPLYTPRYLIVTAPAVAVVLAVAVRACAGVHRWATVALVVVLAVATASTYLSDRGPYGRMGGTDFSAVADYVGTHAHTGDCVAFDRAPSWSPVSQRVIRSAKPDDFRGLRDIGARVDAVRSGQLWDVGRPIDDYRGFADSCDVMWVITDGERNHGFTTYPGGTLTWHFRPFHFTETALYRALSAGGLHIKKRTPFNHSQVVQMVR